MEGEEQTGPCEPPGPSCADPPGYAVLLLEHGVLCVLPILWAALLFSEAGGDFWTCCGPAVSPREGGREEGGGEWTRGRQKNVHVLQGRQEHDGSGWLKLQIASEMLEPPLLEACFLF